MAADAKLMTPTTARNRWVESRLMSVFLSALGYAGPSPTCTAEYPETRGPETRRPCGAWECVNGPTTAAAATPPPRGRRPAGRGPRAGVVVALHLQRDV